MSRSSQRGFTLIELVVVIVILGILAAFAVPRFARLDASARTASVRALEGSLGSSAALARSLFLTTGANPVDMEGVAIALTNGYPTRNSIALTLTGNIIDNGDNVPGRYAPTVGATSVEFQLIGAPNPATCRVVYNEAAVGGAPQITTDIGGC